MVLKAIDLFEFKSGARREKRRRSMKVLFHLEEFDSVMCDAVQKRKYMGKLAADRS